jgi:hypothetical protein
MKEGRLICLSPAANGECDNPAMNLGSMPGRPLAAVSTAASSIIPFLHAAPSFGRDRQVNGVVGEMCTSKGCAVVVTKCPDVFRMSNAHRITRPARNFCSVFLPCPLPRVQAPYKVELILRCTPSVVPGGDSCVLRLCRVGYAMCCSRRWRPYRMPRALTAVLCLLQLVGRLPGGTQHPARTILVPISKHFVKHIAAVPDAGTVSRPVRVLLPASFGLHRPRPCGAGRLG